MEKTSQKNKIQCALFVLAITVLFVLTYLLNRLYPILGEDWDYLYFWGEGGPAAKLIGGVSDIFVSQYNHYMTWSGRSIVHAIDQFLLMTGSIWHDPINSLAYVLFVYMIYHFINWGHHTNALLFVSIAILLWVFLPELPTLTLWITYSSVYLWATLLILLFIYPFYCFYMERKGKSSWYRFLGIFIFGIIAGWTNENMSITLLAFLFLFLVTLKYQKIKIPKWIIAGFVGACIGSSILILAPGNFARMGSSLHKNTPDLIHRVWHVVKEYTIYLAIPSMIYSITFYYVNKKLKFEKVNELLTLSLLFFISAHIGVIVMIASPIVPARTFFGLIVFVIIGIGILIMKILELRSQYKKYGIILTLCLSVYFSYDYIQTYKYTSYLNSFWKKREMKVLEMKKKGVKHIEFSEGLKSHKGFVVYDFKNFPEGWPNSSYAKHYGINSVILY